MTTLSTTDSPQSHVIYHWHSDRRQLFTEILDPFGHLLKHLCWLRWKHKIVNRIICFCAAFWKWTPSHSSYDGASAQTDDEESVISWTTILDMDLSWYHWLCVSYVFMSWTKQSSFYEDTFHESLAFVS